MAEKNSSVVDQFIEKKDVPSDQRPALEAFVAFLEERGQFMPTGDLKSALIEKKMVLDAKKIPIEVSECAVCGHQEFEVKPEPES
jgi:hypothetical protein